MLKILFILNKLISEIYSKFDNNIPNKKIFLSQEESLNYLINSNKSLIRWGDGESAIFTGGNLYFQNNSLKLLIDFFKIVRNYKNNSQYLIALPNEFLINTKENLIETNKYKIWKFTRYIFNFFFKKDVIYLDSFMFREGTSLANQEIERLWLKERKIIFIHSNYKYYLDFKTKYKEKDIYFISVTSANSYSQKSKILKKVEEIFVSSDSQKNDFCIMVSSGPAGKTYVYELSKIGFKALDLGHYFDYKFYDIERKII